jgi:starvation-inducible outer membrane lipoprotein
MMGKRIGVFLLLACVLVVAGGWLAPAPAAAQQVGASAQKSTMTPREAAAKARAQHGGKVLNVSRQGGVYRVKLLLDSGRVITVTVKG